ncbi:LacI family transcriptional regulator [Paenibacillaceae bacterium]|nr:LacI family transcriptional regulator [Paenibacillaceae bacterium]
MATRDDVAKHAGVSVAVVSYVINNKDNVKEATRQKVLRAIAELGYNPNLTARSLKTKRTGQFGVLFNSLSNPFETGIALGLEERARQFGHSLIFQTYVRSEEEKLKMIFMGRTDGLILMGQSLSEETISHFAQLDVPVYSITSPVNPSSHVRYIDIDWHEAMMRLIGHLKEQGHSRIGFMGHVEEDHPLHPRYTHFRNAMRELELEFPEEALLQAAGSLETAYTTMSNRLAHSGNLPFTAIICANGLMGIGVMSACKDHGLTVPQDLSVAACEDILMASHTTPGLTTLYFPRRDAGFQTIDMLLDQVNNGSKTVNSMLDVGLTIRGSTRTVRG